MNCHYSNEMNGLTKTNTKAFCELFYFVVFIEIISAYKHECSSLGYLKAYY